MGAILGEEDENCLEREESLEVAVLETAKRASFCMRKSGGHKRAQQQKEAYNHIYILYVCDGLEYRTACDVL